MPKKLNLEDVIARFNEKHGNKYDYSKFKNLGHSVASTVICPVHGEFSISAKHHYNRGCTTCNGTDRLTLKSTTAKIKEKYNDKFKIVKISKNVNSRSTISVSCPEHGVFDIRVSSLLSKTNKHGCGKCGRMHGDIKKRKNIKTFKEQIKILHSNIDCGREIKYINKSKRIELFCNIHKNVFTQSPESLLKGNIGCPACKTSGVSIREMQLYNFIKDVLPNENIIQNDRMAIKPKELDIYIPNLNIAFEFDGIRWHNEGHNGSKYSHKIKQDMCKNKKIRLIQIYEDEWVDRENIVKLKILSILGLDPRSRLYARKTNIKQIDKESKKIFLNANHIQGNCRSNLDYGLFFENEMVAVMSFMLQKNVHVLTRYATSKHVIGGFSKLLKHFERNNDWNKLISFSDNRWSDGGLYESNNWILDKELPVDYYYVHNSTRLHKFNFRRSKLKLLLKEKFDSSKSEFSNTYDNGIFRLWDSGKKRYIKKPSF